MARLSLVALLCTAAAGAAAAAAASGHSQEKPWVPNLPGGGVEWTSFANATRQDGAAPSDRPILALLHRGHCGACKALKASFAAIETPGATQQSRFDYARFRRLSESFTMVSASDADAAGPKTRAQALFPVPARAGALPHEDARLQPQGADYVPRVVFLAADGTPRPEVVNPRGITPQFPYFYTEVGQIADAMEAVLGLAWAGGSGGGCAERAEKKEDKYTDAYLLAQLIEL